MVADTSNDLQIYSATYSNVPVFEFVTSEGPIMRRKLDAWINATHILKIAKFPKAKRTRILEKDVQTGIHEKVQGGYGKYQGTYVPLELGADIAKSFGVYEVLKPIFEFHYVEGKTELPPPAPKHSHASASNMGKKQTNTGLNYNNVKLGAVKRSRSLTAASTAEPPKKRGRPKRVALSDSVTKPSLRQNKTTPLETGPSIGTFKDEFAHPSLHRQDTEQDALQVMASNMSVKKDELEPVESDDEDDDDDDENNLMIHNQIGSHKGNLLTPIGTSGYLRSYHDDDELMSVRELFGTPRDSFERIVQHRNSYSVPQSANPNHSTMPHLPTLNGSITFNQEPYSLQQYHHNPAVDNVYADYFKSLLDYLSDDNFEASSTKETPGKVRLNSIDIPEKLLNPPQPLSKININQPIDGDGNSIFHWACSMGSIAIIEFLLSIFSNFINANITNSKGETPLMFLVRFVNAYEFQNFPSILELLFDSILSVDHSGKTVLHHIALASELSNKERNQNTNKRKGRFSRYYMECMLKKLVEIQDLQTNGPEEKRQLVSKFLNHQDNDGNTAFHIVSYNLNKKCIKLFIEYHKYIDLSLQNLVHHTVEDYLAFHNYVLRLDPKEEDADAKPMVMVPSSNKTISSPVASFQSQLYNSSVAINMQNSTSNLITEKLSELSYVMDKELREKDRKLLDFINFMKLVNLEKLESQRDILRIFKLEYLLEGDFNKAANEERIEEKNGESSQATQEHAEDEDDDGKSTGGSLVPIDNTRDELIQEEIDRLVNDLSFQVLTKKEEYTNSILSYMKANEAIISAKLGQSIQKEEKEEAGTEDDQAKLALELQQEIIKRQHLSQEIMEKLAEVPVRLAYEDVTDDKADNKENRETHENSIIGGFPHSDRLYKYCKLISLCCGMSFEEVENSIDMIEQSLSKSKG